MLRGRGEGAGQMYALFSLEHDLMRTLADVFVIKVEVIIFVEFLETCQIFIISETFFDN